MHLPPKPWRRAPVVMRFYRHTEKLHVAVGNSCDVVVSGAEPEASRSEGRTARGLLWRWSALSTAFVDVWTARTTTMRIYAWIVILFTLGILAVRFAPTEPPVDQVPDREGKLTFHGPDYQLRAPRDQVAVVSRNPDGSQTVELSVDRREFGSPDKSGPRRIVCTPGGSCIDYCAPAEVARERPCADIVDGWYRVTVGPISQKWGLREWSIPPRDAGPGFRCGDDGHSGLEYCWDPVRYTPTWPVANVHDVPYDAIRQSAGSTWVSIARDADGLPTFYAMCAGRVFCSRFIDKAGARVELDFAFAELHNWQRLEAGLRGFADRLIVPSPGKNGAATAPNRGTARS